MVGNKITALALAAALLLSPALAVAQDSGEAAGEEGIDTPFGKASPVLVGGAVVGAIIGLTIALDDDDDDDEGTGATGTGGTGASGTQ